MKNVYDIKREKNLNFILPKKTYLPGAAEISCREVLVVIHLHYEETVSHYYSYFSQIPSEMDILFTTSEPKVRSRLEMYRDAGKREFKIVEKLNRGRDISALLVACREEIMKYPYVCFVHDKKAKSEDTKKDVDIFIKCLWENTLGSEIYIKNIVYSLKNNPLLGLLLPPESFSDNYKFAYTNTWDQDYELMKNLAEKLHLHCDLNPGKKPISLGTVFWAKMDALRKLLEWEWKYEDFNPEPLPGDGTISHAVERSLAYVAQDAGYDTGIVMNDQFAGERFDAMQDVMTETFDMLRSILGIHTIGELKGGNHCYQPMLAFAGKYQELYIYGAGVYGQACAKILRASSVFVDGFIVSEKKNEAAMINDLPVKVLREMVLDDDKGIIIAVGEQYRREITENIRRKNPMFGNVFYFL